MAKKKTNLGARGKYLDWITPEGLLKVEGWARDGLTDMQIAQNIGIKSAAFYEWKKKYPEFTNALKKGKEVVDREVENALYKNALGYFYDEVTKERDELGDLVVTKVVRKHAAPNTTAQIFWLKNRKRAEWRDRHETEITGNLNVANIANEIDDYLNSDST